MALYAFYQEVRIVRPVPENLVFGGRLGVVIGLAEESGEPVGYGLAVEGEEQIVCCEEAELEATGRQFRREDFYDDAAGFRVCVDGEGRGRLG